MDITLQEHLYLENLNKYNIDFVCTLLREFDFLIIIHENNELNEFQQFSNREYERLIFINMDDEFSYINYEDIYKIHINNNLRVIDIFLK
jgi:hypothetical protein